MTTAKEKYYELKKQTDKYFEGFRDPIHDYVTELEQELKDSELRRKDLLTSLQRSNAQKKELEQELTKLKESQTQKSIIKLCNRVDKAEAENNGLRKAISFYYTYHKDSRNDGIIFEEFNKICPMK